jgi:DNA-directed RNA polymerase II subunit RPB11
MKTRMVNRIVCYLSADLTDIQNFYRQLLKDPRVLFAGYKVPHPLEHNFVLKIQTAPDTTPEIALGDAITELIQEIGQLKNKFEMDVIRQRAFEDAKASHGAGMDGDDMALDPHRAGLDVDF